MKYTGTHFNIKMLSYFIGMDNSMLKERRPVGRLSFNMVLPILVRWRLYTETGPRLPHSKDTNGHVSLSTTPAEKNHGSITVYNFIALIFCKQV